MASAITASVRVLGRVGVALAARRLPAVVGDLLMAAFFGIVWSSPLLFGPETPRSASGILLFEFLRAQGALGMNGPAM